MKKLKEKMLGLQISGLTTLEKSKKMLMDKKGQGALDTAITVLIAIVLGALILGGLYLIIEGTVLPTVTQKIEEMFNYSN